MNYVNPKLDIFEILFKMMLPQASEHRPMCMSLSEILLYRVNMDIYNSSNWSILLNELGMNVAKY
jgi:hypothetical protein